MGECAPWQSCIVEELSLFFEQEPDARAFILSGSLAVPGQADGWSDVDAKVVIADCALDRYALSAAWLAPFGQLLGVERHDHGLTKTLRVCLDRFRRIDLTFIAESAVRLALEKQPPLFHPSDVVLWSRLPNSMLPPNESPLSEPYRGVTAAEIESMADAFWFKAAAATAKVVRNDLLIGFHLALDLVRDCLVLQMIRRDRQEQTTIHRIGGWGNEVVERFFWSGAEESALGILSLIQLSGESFDALAADLSPSYVPRGSLLLPAIEAARQS